MAYNIDKIVIVRKIAPPTVLPERLLFMILRSSLELGSNFTKKIPLTCKNVVRMVSLANPDKSPDNIVFSVTSQIFSMTVLIADARLEAALLTVVNIAYDAPSLPLGHKCTIIIVVGFEGKRKQKV